MTPGPVVRFRFGPYEADVTAGELRKNGQPVRLQEQPFQILVALLSRPGELVTRDELRERLWPSDSFGDFDQGLNTAINKLREGLGDSAGNPQFIETLPKRGYRFTYPIEAQPVTVATDKVRNGGKRASLLPITMFVGFAVVLLAIWSVRQTPNDPQLPLRRFTIREPVPTGTVHSVRLTAISPNGKHVAIIADEGENKLWIQDLDQDQPRAVEGTEGAVAPFWSPDSSMIGFTAAGKLKKIPVTGGPAIPMCDLPEGFTCGSSWSPDGGSIIFTAGSPCALYSVPASGGTAKLLLSAQMLEQEREPGWIIHPQFLPAARGPHPIVFAYNRSLIVMDLKTGLHHNVGSGSYPFYSHAHLLYRYGGDLWARPFSLEQMQFVGEAFPVARSATDPSLASDGTLVYRDSPAEQLVWRDRGGTRVGTLGQSSNGMYYPAISPDGNRVGVEILDNDNPDVWVSDVQRGTRIRLSSNPATEVLPVWAPAGDQVAYSSYRSGNTDIFLRRADAGSEENALPSTSHNERVSDWSRDGQYILYSLLHPTNGNDLWYLKRTSDGKWATHAFMETPFDERAPKLSPDGRYVAYLSNESGRYEVYVRQFPSGGRKWPVSTGGASQIRWSRNGRELFYVETGTLIAVSVRTKPGFAISAAVRLFSHPAFTAWPDPNFDVSSDGRRVLLPDKVGSQEKVIHVVQNWLAQFEDRR